MRSRLPLTFALATALLVVFASTASAGTARKEIPSNNMVRYIKTELATAEFFMGGAINNRDTRLYRLAIENYQRATGFPDNGIITAAQQMRLAKLLKEGGTTATSPPPGSQVKSKWVRKLQRILRQVFVPNDGGRFYPHKVTGVYGGGTVRAVMLFQSCAAIPVDGFYGSETRHAMIRFFVNDKPLPCIGSDSTGT